MANNPSARWCDENRRLYNGFLRSAPVLQSVVLPSASVSGASAPVSASASQSTSAQQGGRAMSRRNRPFGACYNCGRFGHFINSCPYASVDGVASRPRPRPNPAGSRAQVSQSSASGPASGNNAVPPFRAPPPTQPQTGQTCNAWNAGQACPPGCRRDHRCSFCSGLHPRCDCTSHGNLPGV